jgi:hypothetical protein
VAVETMNKTFRNTNTLKSGFLANKSLKKKAIRNLFGRLELPEKIEAVSYWCVIDDDEEMVCDGFNVFRSGNEGEKKLVSICKVKCADEIFMHDDDKEYESSPIFEAIFELLRTEVKTK